jgi:hypothetical protein
VGQRLVPTSTEVRCRICASPKRAEIESLLSRLGQTDEVYGKLTLDRIARTIIPALDGGGALSPSSLKRHRRLHTRPSDGSESGDADGGPAPAWEDDDERQAVIAELERLLGLPEIPASAVHALHARLHLAEVKRKLERGEKVVITPDQASRAASAMGRSELERGQSYLLESLALGVQSAFSRPGAIGGYEPAELIEGEVEDAEVEEGDGDDA